MAEFTSLREAVRDPIQDGATVALEGFTHLIPSAAGHELIRHDRRDLRLVRMTPDIIYDQLIGVGAARALLFSWGGNPGVGSLHRLRDAVEHGWPRPLELEEYSHAMLAAAYVAGASALPFGVVRGGDRTDITAHNANLETIQDPFTAEPVLAVRAVRPDVTVIHAQQADRAGRVMLWGIVGIQKEAAMAAARVLVTVEEVVDEFTPRLGGVILPASVATVICEVPGGTHPSYALGYSRRDNAFYRSWDAVSRDRERFASWIDRHVRGTEDMADFLRSIAST